MPSRTSRLSMAVSEYSWRTQYIDKTGKYSFNKSGYFKDWQKSSYRSSDRRWSNTANFRAKVEAGIPLPDNAMSADFIVDGHVFGGGLSYAAGDPYNPGNMWYEQRENHCSNLYIPGTIEQPWPDSVYAAKLISKAKGAEWSAPIFFAELGKTADMVVKSATRLTSMFLALRKGNFKRFVGLFHRKSRRMSARQLNRASRRFGRQFGKNPWDASRSAWLEYKYGWTPFVLDVHNAFELLSEIQNDPLKRVGTVRTGITADRVQTINGFTTSLAGIRQTGTARISHKLSGRAVWRYSINENLNDIGKVGLTNPLNVAWELVPLSFVADWFLPIGDYLASLDAPLRFSHIGGAYGYKQESTGVVNNITYSSGWSGPTSSKTGKRIYVRARPMLGIPSMRLLELPFKVNLEHGRAISAIALLSNVFKASKR